MKNVRFDEMKGGSLQQTTLKETTQAPVADFTSVVQPAQVSTYQGDPTQFYRSAYDYLPKNAMPYSQYEPLFQSRQEVYLKHTLTQGLSGYGADKDDSSVQKAMVHSFKGHPEMLQIYLEGKA